MAAEANTLKADETPWPRASWRQLLVLFCVAALVPGYLLVTRPPLYNTDSFNIAGFEWSVFVVPHFPPLYPVFTRAVNAATMYLFYRHTGDFHSGMAMNLNDVGTYAIVIIQHLLGVLSLVALATHLARTFPRRLVVLVLLLLNPTFFLCCHNIMTEGLMCSLVVFQLVFALRVWRHSGAGTWGGHLGCFVCLYLGILTRHPAAVLAALVPGLALLGLLWRRDRAGVMKLALSLTASLLAIYAAEATTKRFCRSINGEYVSVWGRAGIYRTVWGLRWSELSPERREEFVRKAQDQARSPQTVR
jgi:hypothetical protein